MQPKITRVTIAKSVAMLAILGLLALFVPSPGWFLFLFLLTIAVFVLWDCY